MTREIPLTRGYVAIVDDEDYDKLAAHKWRAHVDKRTQHVYAVREVSAPGIRFARYTERMAKVVLNAGDDVIVDHINGKTLDNTRRNLRKSTRQQNAYNQQGRGAYKGITYHKASGKWVAQIMHNYVNVYLGIYATPEEAARAYDEAARKRFGAFARVNFP